MALSQSIALLWHGDSASSYFSLKETCFFYDDCDIHGLAGLELMQKDLLTDKEEELLLELLELLLIMLLEFSSLIDFDGFDCDSCDSDSSIFSRNLFLRERKNLRSIAFFLFCGIRFSEGLWRIIASSSTSSKSLLIYSY